MSVINKMLRDLDRQQQHQRSHGPLILQRKSRWSWLPWFIIPLALVAGWLGQAWFTRQATPEQTPIVGEAEVEHSQLSPLTAEDEPLRQQAASAQRTVPEAPVELTPVTPLPAAPLAETGATTAEPAQNPIAEPVQAEQATRCMCAFAPQYRPSWHAWHARSRHAMKRLPCPKTPSHAPMQESHLGQKCAHADSQPHQWHGAKPAIHVATSGKWWTQMVRVRPARASNFAGRT